MKKNDVKYWLVLLNLTFGLAAFSQINYIKFGLTLPGSSAGTLVGNGVNLALGKESDKILNVRARVVADFFVHSGSTVSFTGFDHYGGGFGGDIIQSQTYTSSMFLNSQLVASLDYFLLKRYPNFYFGPDAFLSYGVHSYNQKNSSVLTSGGGLKTHFGFEKPTGKKLKFFGEYAISYVVTSPYFAIEPPVYSSQAEKKTWWFTSFHQFGIGFRF